MMKSYRALLLVGIALAFCLPKSSRSSGSGVYAATIHVPADQPTIQAGINAAVNEDTVLVAPGVYTGGGNRQIVFYGKGGATHFRERA